jgi:hypothetical protein
MKVDIKDFVAVYEDAFPKEYCDKVIKYFDQGIAAGLGKTRQDQYSEVTKREINDLQLYAHSELSLGHTTELISIFSSIFWQELYPLYKERFDILAAFAAHTNYAFKIQKVDVGQGYHTWHTESMDKGTSTRILTWILYLNDVEEGGETEFLYYPKRIKPSAGTFILWPAGFTHTHRGNPPISGTKYIVTGWVEF